MANQTPSTTANGGNAETSARTQASVADLSAQIDRIRTDIADLTRIVGDVANSGAREARAAVRARVAEAGEEGREMLTRAEDRLRAYTDDAGDYVRRNPVQSLAIAAGLGLAVGYLTRR